MKHQDLTNKRFGYLEPIDYIGSSKWLCKCHNCGGKKVIRTDHLKKGYAESCGCLKKEQATWGKRKTNKHIIQTAKGQNVYIDPEDVEELSKYSWSIGIDGYAQAKIDGKMVRLHEFLLGKFRGPGLVIDHINRDPLNNRKENLRIVSKRQNALNRAG